MMHFLCRIVPTLQLWEYMHFFRTLPDFSSKKRLSASRLLLSRNTPSFLCSVGQRFQQKCHCSKNLSASPTMSSLPGLSSIICLKRKDMKLDHQCTMRESLMV